MKQVYYLFPDGSGYQSFLAHRVPKEFQGKTIDKLPDSIVQAEAEAMRKMKVRAQVKDTLVDAFLSGNKTWEQAQAEAQAIDNASKEAKE